MKHTGDFDHKCPYCPFGRDAKYEVEDHINAVHLKKVIYQCSECSFHTYRKISLRSHHKDHETKELLACPGCSTKSIYPSTMAKHIKDEHPDLPFPDELRDARRKNEQKNIVSGDVDYTPVLMCKCKLCDFTCERIVKLKSHVRRVHNQGTRNRCVVCKMTFANKRNLKNHIAKQHPGVNIAELEEMNTLETESAVEASAVAAAENAAAGGSREDTESTSDFSLGLVGAPVTGTDNRPSQSSSIADPNMDTTSVVSTDTATIMFLSDIAK